MFVFSIKAFFENGNKFKNFNNSVYFCNVLGCVCVGFVLYGCVRLM